MSKPLRIGIIAGPLLPVDSTCHLIDLARSMMARQHQVLILTMDGPLVHRFRDAGITMAIYKDFRKPILNTAILGIMSHRLQTFKADILHAFHPSVSPVAASLSRKLKIPYVITIHSFMQSNTRLSIHAQWCKKIIAVSETVREDLVNTRKVMKELIDVIPNGIHITEAKRRQVPKEFRHDDTKVIGTAGRMSTVKGHTYFLDAARKILQSKHKVHFMLFGDGRLNSQLRKQAQMLNIHQTVTFVNHLLDYRDVIPGIDIYVSSSLHEGFSLAVLEAMSWKKPVVASAVGGIYNLIEDGTNGILVPKENSKAMAQAVVNLLDDPAYARRLGMAGLRIAQEKFPLQRTVDSNLAIYQHVLGLQEPDQKTKRLVSVASP